jgi:hypothetical protein
MNAYKVAEDVERIRAEFAGREGEIERTHLELYQMRKRSSTESLPNAEFLLFPVGARWICCEMTTQTCHSQRGLLPHKRRE